MDSLSALTRPQLFLLAVILLMAALLRFAHLDQIEHNVDHAYPIWQALTTLDRGVLPLAGQGTSVLFANPALTGYLFLPGLALARSPISAYVLVIALNTLGVYLAFAVARRLLNVPVALLTAGLLAVNPWMIEYSRATWVQGLLPFFASALAWALWPVLVEVSRRPGRRLILAFVVLALYTQTYLLTFMVLAPVGLLILWRWKPLPKRPLLIGISIFIAASALYGIGLLQQASTVQSRLTEFSSAPRQFRPEALDHALRLISGADYAIARGVDAAAQDSALRQTLSQVAHGIVVVGILAGIVLAISYQLPVFGKKPVSVSQPPSTQLAFILLVWFAFPIVFMLYVGQPIHPFYQIMGTPAGHILAVWGCFTLARWLTRSPRRAGVLLTGLFIPLAALSALNSLRYAEETAITAGVDGLTALPIGVGLQLGEAINAYLPVGGRVLSDGSEWILNSLSGQLYPVMNDVRAPVVQLIPAEGGLLLRTGYGEGFASLPYAERVWDWSKAELPGVFHLTLDRYAPGLADDLLIPVPLRLAGQEGIDLLGYGLEQSNNQVTLTTDWQVSATPPGSGVSLFAPFIHVYDASAERVQIIDGQTVAGGDWRVGDVHIHRMTFMVPESGGPFRLEIGQFDGIAGRNVIFLPDYSPTIQLPGFLQ
jgi:hypothetical protein